MEILISESEREMADQVCTALLLLVLATAVECAPAVCNVTYPLISGDRFRLLDSSFSASSYLDSSHTASDARLLQTASRGWCSGELLSIEPQWLEIAFPVGVVISAISTAGTTNAYTVLYSMDSMDTLETYREPGSATVKIFNVSALDSANGSTNATLHEPVVLKRLRIYPYSWSANPACLLVEVYGCPLKPVCEFEVNLYTASDVLPPDNIISSSGEGVPQLLQEDSFVCFPFTAQSTLPYITLNFTHPTYITRAETLFPIHLADNSNVYETYVDRYTIEVSTDGNSFSMYTLADGTEEIQTDKVNTFWEPVRAIRYLRLTITAVQAAFGQVCWHLQLFGCTTSQGYNSSEVDPPVDLVTDSSLSSSIASTQSPSPMISMPAQTDVNNSHGNHVRKDYLVVEVVVPVAGLTILVVVTVCVIGVAVCAQLKRTADYKLKLLTPPSGPIRYGRQSPTLTGHTTAPSPHERERTIKVVHNTLYRTTEGNPIEDSGVALSHNLSYETVQFATEAGVRHLTRISENYEMAPLDVCGAVSEGYELVGSGVSPPEPQSDLHDYDSIRLSQLYAPVSGGGGAGWMGGGGVVHPPLSQTVSAQSCSEYEMMESVQCLEDNHINRPVVVDDPSSTPLAIYTQV